MPENLFLIPLLFIGNILEIFGFYAACDYENEDDELDFDVLIETGVLRVFTNGVLRKMINPPDALPNKKQHYKIKSPHKTSDLRFEPSEEATITLDNISLKEIIDEDSKNIFWFIKYYSKKWLGDYWSKPIASCPICMSSLHSLWIWIPIYIIMPFSFFLLCAHAFYMLALAGINKLILVKFEI